MVDRYREAGRDAVLSMWQSQTNEDGQGLSRFEREALIERHCELFGTWPSLRPCRVRGVKARTLADLELVDSRITEGQQRVADQRRRIAEAKGVGEQRWLFKCLLVNFEATLLLMIERRNMIVRELTGIGPN